MDEQLVELVVELDIFGGGGWGIVRTRFFLRFPYGAFVYLCMLVVVLHLMPAYLGYVGIAVIPILQGIVVCCSLSLGVLIG